MSASLASQIEFAPFGIKSEALRRDLHSPWSMDPAGKKAPKDNPLGVKGEWLCHGDVLWRPPSKGLVLGKRVEIGSSGASQVGSERRTYELLSLRPTIQGGQVGPKWRQVVPKCRQNVPPKLPKGSHKFPTRFPIGVFFSPQRSFRERFWVRSRKKADLLQA